MKNKKIESVFGYDYDEINKCYILNEAQANVIKTIVDLNVNYLLDYDEIDLLIKSRVDIYGIIALRISALYETIDEYDLNIDKNYDDINIADQLEKDSNCSKDLINHLNNVKTKISVSEEIDNKIIKKCIDDNIKLINERETILNEYGDFKDIKSVIVDYIKSNKDINSSRYSYKEFLNKVNDVNKMVKTYHQSVVSVEKYKEVSEKLKLRDDIEIEK